MTHQKRANAVLTTVNSCSGVGHLCACPVLCRNSPVQTSIRGRRLQKTKRPTRMLAASVRGGQAQRAEARRHFGGQGEKLCFGSVSHRSIKKFKHPELALKPQLNFIISNELKFYPGEQINY